MWCADNFSVILQDYKCRNDWLFVIMLFAKRDKILIKKIFPVFEYFGVLAP